MSAAFALSACGGSSRSGASDVPVSKAAYVRQADTLCSHYQGGIAGLVKTMEANAGSAKAFKHEGGFFTGAVQFIAREAGGIEALPRAADEHGDLATMFGSLQRAVAVLRAATPVVNRGDVLAFGRSGTRAMALAARGRRAGAAYGFTGCLRIFE